MLRCRDGSSLEASSDDLQLLQLQSIQNTKKTWRSWYMNHPQCVVYEVLFMKCTSVILGSLLFYWYYNCIYIYTYTLSYEIRTTMICILITITVMTIIMILYTYIHYLSIKIVHNYTYMFPIHGGTSKSFIFHIFQCKP